MGNLRAVYTAGALLWGIFGGKLSTCPPPILSTRTALATRTGHRIVLSFPVAGRNCRLDMTVHGWNINQGGNRGCGGHLHRIFSDFEAYEGGFRTHGGMIPARSDMTRQSTRQSGSYPRPTEKAGDNAATPRRQSTDKSPRHRRPSPRATDCHGNSGGPDMATAIRWTISA